MSFLPLGRAIAARRVIIPQLAIGVETPLNAPIWESTVNAPHHLTINRAPAEISAAVSCVNDRYVYIFCLFLAEEKFFEEASWRLRASCILHIGVEEGRREAPAGRSQPLSFFKREMSAVECKISIAKGYGHGFVPAFFVRFAFVAGLCAFFGAVKWLDVCTLLLFSSFCGGLSRGACAALDSPRAAVLRQSVSQLTQTTFRR